MGFVVTTILNIIFRVLTVLLHLVGAAMIVLLFFMRMNTEDERLKRRYLTWMILIAVLLIGILMIRPILFVLRLFSLFK